MGATGWFRRIFGGKPAEAEAPMPPEAAEVAGLNFMTAIDAHVQWRARLESYILGTSGEVLEVDIIGRDDHCRLGKWIYGPGGEQFGGLDAFGEMKHQHAAFHQCAGKVLAAAQAGRKEEALRLLHHGDYVRASEQVKRMLAKLYVRVDAGG